MTAGEQTGRLRVAIAGGAAANTMLRERLENECRRRHCRLWMPELALCGDNGAMIGCQGYYEYLAGHCAEMDLNAYATRSIDQG